MAFLLITLFMIVAFQTISGAQRAESCDMESKEIAEMLHCQSMNSDELDAHADGYEFGWYDEEPRDRNGRRPRRNKTFRLFNKAIDELRLANQELDQIDEKLLAETNKFDLFMAKLVTAGNSFIRVSESNRSHSKAIEALKKVEEILGEIDPAKCACETFIARKDLQKKFLIEKMLHEQTRIKDLALSGWRRPFLARNYSTTVWQARKRLATSALTDDLSIKS